MVGLNGFDRHVLSSPAAFPHKAEGSLADDLRQCLDLKKEWSDIRIIVKASHSLSVILAEHLTVVTEAKAAS